MSGSDTIRVFVSYSHRDLRWLKDDTWGLVPWLSASLRGRGVELWYDADLRRLPGEDYRRKIRSEIDAADAVLLLLSQDYVNSDFIREHELPGQAFTWYIDLRRFGSVPHSGFGLGVERTVAWITGAKHIREASPYPRTLGRLYP